MSLEPYICRLSYFWAVCLATPDYPIAISPPENLVCCYNNLVIIVVSWLANLLGCFVIMMLRKCSSIVRETASVRSCAYLTVAVSPFCIAFALMWAVFRRVSFDWIGQDILVGSILLGYAFLYDIFWVFVSKWWFHESVMIAVARGDWRGEDGIPMLKIPQLFDPWVVIVSLDLGTSSYPGF